jgi:hypothetical protein
MFYLNNKQNLTTKFSKYTKQCICGNKIISYRNLCGLCVLCGSFVVKEVL